MPCQIHYAAMPHVRKEQNQEIFLGEGGGMQKNFTNYKGLFEIFFEHEVLSLEKIHLNATNCMAQIANWCFWTMVPCPSLGNARGPYQIKVIPSAHQSS